MRIFLAAALPVTQKRWSVGQPVRKEPGHGRGPTSPHTDLPAPLGALGVTARPHGAIRKAKPV